MDDKQERHTSRTFSLLKHVGNWLKVAGELRDGFLVTAGVFYLFGYIVWAINAHRNDLSLLPALEFQYFIAGIVPVLIILALYLIVIGIKLLRKNVSAWLGPSATGWKLFLCWVMFGLGIVALIHILANDAEWFNAAFPNIVHRGWLVGISALIIMASYLFFGPIESVLDRYITTEYVSPSNTLRELGRTIAPLIGLPVVLLSWLAQLYTFLFLIALPILSFIFFVWEFYPKIPQEFGGARPRYACLDVVKAQISKETIEGIIPFDANKSNEPVVRSLRVEVLFSGSDVMLVRSQGRVYKITKSTIQAVSTCD